MSKIVVVLLFAGLVAAVSAYVAKHEDDDESDHEEERHYYQLFKQLEHHYEKRAIPIGEDKAPVNVDFGLTLRHINVDPGSQELTLLAWAKLEWYDNRLTWEPEHYDGIAKIKFRERQIWTPDMSLFNGLDVDYFPHSKHTEVIVYHNGKAFWVTPVQFRVYTSHVSLEETTTFSVKVGSWTYDDTMIDIHFSGGTKGFDVSEYTAHHCWHIEETTAQRNVLYYPCCPEGYLDLTFYLTLKYTC